MANRKPVGPPKVLMPGTMEWDHFTHPFRSSSPNPGLNYPPMEKPKTGSMRIETVTRSKVDPLDAYRNDTKETALRRVAEIYKTMKTNGHATDYIKEFFIILYNSELLPTDKVEKDPVMYRKYLDLTREEGRTMFDIDTGEPLKFTSSVWTSKEGRLDVNMPSILGMATGHLDIERRAKDGDFIYVGAKAATPKKVSPIKDLTQNIVHSRGSYHKHSLFKEFLHTGPLTPIHHKYWSAKTGMVEAPDGIVLAEDNDVVHSEHHRHHHHVHNQGRVDSAIPVGDSLNTIDAVEFPSSSPDVDRKLSISDHTLDSAAGTRSVSSRSASSSSHSVASSMRKNTTHKPGKKGREKEVAYQSIIPSEIDPNNVELWRSVEEKVYKDLYEKVNEMEHNKRWTKEPLLPPIYKKNYQGKIIGEEDRVKVCARTLAKLKTKGMREVTQAISDEEARDAKRKQVEEEYKGSSKKLTDALKKHDKERHDHRTYLRTLQYNNEIVFINKMASYGLLW